MNFSLAKEIYGLTPWLMDVHSIPVMTSILGSLKNGIALETPEVKLNTPFVYNFDPLQNRLISYPWQLNTQDDFEGVGVIKLNGPITKNGGKSSLGMLQVSNIMEKLSEDSRIKAFVLPTDSGGGSSSAVDIMVDTINKVKQTKPVIALIEKGGLAASAAYGIISACDEIYAEDEMSIVGSVGTMIQFEGREANSKDSTGLKHIRLYATKSTKKNEGFEEALNNDNYKILINDLLDPINEKFIDMVSANRPNINSTDFDNGKTYFAEKVVGTYIDGIKSFEEVVKMSMAYKKQKKGSIITSNKLKINNKKKMTKAEFKTANPDAYAEIVAEGVASERDRSGAWLAHVKTDPTAVINGINSGDFISQTEREAFFVKQNAQSQARGMQEDSAEDFNTPESKSGKEVAQAEIEIKESFDFELK